MEAEREITVEDAEEEKEETSGVTQLTDFFDGSYRKLLPDGRTIIAVPDLPVGTSLESSIYDGEGELLIRDGIPISQAIVDGLLRRGITEVFMKSSRPRDFDITGPESTPTEPEAEQLSLTTVPPDIDAPENVPETLKRNSVKALEYIFSMIGVDDAVDLYELHSSCSKIVERLVGRRGMQPSVIDLYLREHTVSRHSVNVLTTFATTCAALGIDKRKVNECIIATVLHDIGKVIIRKFEQMDRQKKYGMGRALQDRVEKWSKSAAVDVLKMHTEVGFHFLMKMGCIEDDLLDALRNHHERLDGRGYPRKLSGARLSHAAQVLILANEYEALTWDEAGTEKTRFHEAMKRIVQHGSRLVDCQIVNAFLKIYGYYPPGSWVELNSAEIAIVTQSNPGKPRSPIVQVHIDEKGVRLTKPVTVDLSKPGAPYIKSGLGKK